MARFFSTIGLHEGSLEMEVLLESDTEAENLITSSSLHLGCLFEDKLVFEGGIQIISKEETDKYQFRLCREWKPIGNIEDHTVITWDQAVSYLRTEGRSFPHLLESYYYGAYDSNPFVNTIIL